MADMTRENAVKSIEETIATETSIAGVERQFGTTAPMWMVQYWPRDACMEVAGSLEYRGAPSDVVQALRAQGEDEEARARKDEPEDGYRGQGSCAAGHRMRAAALRAALARL